MDQVLAWTILLIFAAALAGVYVSRRARDRCLKGFAGDYVTVEFADGTRAWGCLHVFANALELRYDRPRRRADGNVETSLVIPQERMAEIQSVRRYGAELVEWRRHARQREIEEAYHPAPMRRALRHARNAINTLRDALGQTMGVLIGRARAGGSAGAAARTQDQSVQDLGQTLLGAMGNAYEPVLERHVGRRVVVRERRPDGESVTHVGVLVDYTARWLQVVDCLQHDEHRLPVAEVERLRLCRDLRVAVGLSEAGATYRLELDFRNLGEHACVLQALAGEDYRHALDVDVAPGDGVRCAVDDVPRRLVVPPNGHAAADGGRRGNDEDGASLPSFTVVVVAQRRTDLCLPRSLAAVAHGAEDLP